MKMISRKDEDKRHEDALKDLDAMDVIIGSNQEAIQAENEQHAWTIALIEEREAAVKSFAARKRKTTINFNKAVQDLEWWPGGFPLVAGGKSCDQYDDSDMEKIRIDQAKYNAALKVKEEAMAAIERDEAIKMDDLDGRWTGRKWIKRRVQ